MVRSASLSCLMFVVAAASCGDNGTEPPVGPPGLTIVSGAGANDTIDARLVQALVVEVHTPAGRGVPNAVVRFTSLSARRPDGWTTPGVLVGRLTDATLTSLVVDTTDANSRATALVQLGSVAGETGVEVTVPVLGLVDTARYRVRPGATDSVALTPLDTAVYVGASYAISGRTLDRHGNATDGTVVLTVGDTTVAEVAAASVTGRAYGRTAVVASSGPVRDTAWTSVVPTGVLAVTGYGGVIATVNLDGSGYRQIPVPRTYTGAGIAWAPDGSYLVAGFDDPRTLYRVTTDGGSTRLIAGAAPSVGEITAVDVSADGQETYFSAGYCNYNEVVYRVLGTDAYPVRVSAPVADECFGLVQANVSLSPDGAHAAVEHYGTPYDTPDVQILALASGVAEPLGLLGSHPRWSPRGDRIAYVGDNRVWVVSPDGTGLRAVSPFDAIFQPGLTWSPDGEWLVARYQPISWNVTSSLVLLRVATGDVIPLPPSLAALSTPQWKPTP